MFKKHEIVYKIIESGIIAIIRTNNANEAEKIAKACIKGGINILEITFSVPGADEVLRKLRMQFNVKDLILGAGTVIDSETARIAHLAGASFIVSPYLNYETARLCNRYQVPYIPGCMSPKEIANSLEHGSDLIKLFPASAFSPDIIKAIAGPLPQAQLMPTGGITIDNVQDWFKAGCVAVGVGGSMTSVYNNDYEAISEKAKEFINKIEITREQVKK